MFCVQKFNMIGNVNIFLTKQDGQDEPWRFFGLARESRLRCCRRAVVIDRASGLGLWIVRDKWQLWMVQRGINTLHSTRQATDRGQHNSTVRQGTIRYQTQTTNLLGRRRLRLGSFASDTAGQRRGAVWRRPSRGGATTATGTSPRRSSPAAAAAVSSAGGAVLFLFLF